MRLIKAAIAAAICTTALTACASGTLIHNPQGTDGLANSLGAYSLPKASLSVQVYLVRINNSAGIEVAAEPPHVVSSETFPISAIFDTGHADGFTVDVDPATGFLKEISLNSEDKSQDIAQATGASIGSVASFFTNFFVPGAPPAAAGLVAGGEAAESIKASILLASIELDPTDPTSVRAANKQLWGGVISMLTRVTTTDTCTVKPARGSTPDPTCRAALSILHTAVAPGRWPPTDTDLDQLAARRPFILQDPNPQPRRPGPGCESLAARGPGVCVRAAAEVKVGLAAPNGAFAWRSAHMPVAGQEYLLNVDRAMYASKTFDVVFTDGFAGKRTVTQDSQVLNVAKTPKAVVDAFIDSLGKTTQALSAVIPIRVDYKNARRPSASKSTSATKSTTTDSTGATKTDTTSATTQSSQTGADESATNPAAKGAADPKGGAAQGQAAPKDKDAAPVDAAAGDGQASSNGAPADQKPGGGTQSPASAPTLWFAVCDLDLQCGGPLDSALLGAKDAQAGQTLPQPPVKQPAPAAKPNAPKAPAKAAKPKPTAKSPKPTKPNTPAKPGNAAPCSTPADLKRPECKPIGGK